MAKKVIQNSETDQRVTRYLTDALNPISLQYINGYTIERDADGSSWLKVRVWLDMDRFEEPLPQNEEIANG